MPKRSQLLLCILYNRVRSLFVGLTKFVRSRIFQILKLLSLKGQESSVFSLQILCSELSKKRLFISD